MGRVRDLLDDDGPAADEYRVLVDRLWPRGVKKERLVLDAWDKDVAPSTELRRAFHGGDLDFAQFSEQYRHEIGTSPAPAALLDAAREAGASTLVLIYGVKDSQHNHARLLKDVLETDER
nr:DUF488 family protein [Brachybacterium muris]